MSIENCPIYFSKDLHAFGSFIDLHEYITLRKLTFELSVENYSFIFNSMSKRSYGPDTLQEAVSAVKQKRLNISQASREYGVPRKTVENHVRYDTMGVFPSEKPVSVSLFQ